jgi:soluble lytic murein transglycosylase-like protein
MYTETRFNACAESPKRARGLMQFMPATARSLRVDPYNVEASVYAAARLLRSLYDRYGSMATALAVYNAGTIGESPHTRPPGTSHYVEQILMPTIPASPHVKRSAVLQTVPFDSDGTSLPASR